MKESVTVSRVIRAPRDVAFKVFTTHTTYQALPMVRASNLINPGEGNPSNGVGAIREIGTYGGALKELVTDCKPSEYWDYQFLEWPLPFAHAGGRMSFSDVEGGTLVNWTTAYEAQESTPWQLAVGGISFANKATLELLIRLIGNQAEKQARQ